MELTGLTLTRGAQNCIPRLRKTQQICSLSELLYLRLWRALAGRESCLTLDYKIFLHFLQGPGRVVTVLARLESGRALSQRGPSPVCFVKTRTLSLSLSSHRGCQGQQPDGPRSRPSVPVCLPEL